MAHAFPTRRSSDLVGRRVRQLDRVADGQVLAALRMVDLDDGAGRAQARLLGQLLHGEDRAAGDVQRVAGRHDLRSEEHTSELQSLMRISNAVLCLKKKNETS